MDLVVTADNPAPFGASPAIVRTADGATLRTVRWLAPKGVGTVVIASGRAEFVEKYFEIVGELLARDLSVVAFDWRGQGLSSRDLADPVKGHIDDFALYERDLEAVQDQVLEPFCPKPWFGLGHSMGGSILLAQAHAGRSPFERLVLSSPMIDIALLRAKAGARILCEILDIVGLGGAFVPGGRRRSYLRTPFERNVLTSDRLRYERLAATLTSAPQLSVGDPTIGWVNAAFRLMNRFADPDYPRQIGVPTLIVAAGADLVVDTRATERFGRRLKAGEVLVIPHCLHEILIERDVFRKQFLAAFDAFAPGAGQAPATQPVPAEKKSRSRRPRRFGSRLPTSSAPAEAPGNR
jgi:lysophospholipase